MKWFSNLLRSSVGRKQLMALTGLAMAGFLIGHLSGNFLLFAGDDGVAFNAYAQWLASQFWLVPAEIVLILIFLLHFYLAIRLSLENRRARGKPYRAKGASDASLGARTMLISGILVLAFLIIHLKTFKYGDHGGERGLYGLVVSRFGDPVYSLFYVFCMVVLGFHLSHGIQSVFQTFGIRHAKHTPPIEKLCLLLALVLVVGFASMPLWFLLNRGGA